MIGDSLPVLLAALGGAIAVVAVRDLLPALPVVASWLGRGARTIDAAGSGSVQPSEEEQRRLGYLAALAIGLGAVWLTGSMPLAGLAALGPALAGQAVAARRRRYRRRIEADLPQIAATIADAIASGGSLRQALTAAGTATSGPTAIELAKLRSDLELGLPARSAVVAMGTRVRSAELDALLAAVLSQERAGGDLPGLLRRHGRASAGRLRAERDARAATAQARMTGGMVAAMPLLMAAMVEMASPGFVSGMLGHPIGAILLAVAAALQLAGFLLIRRLGEVRR